MALAKCLKCNEYFWTGPNAYTYKDLDNETYTYETCPKCNR